MQSLGIAIHVMDRYSIGPVDRATLLDSTGIAQGQMLTINDHDTHGGLGNVVLSVGGTEDIKIHKLAVRAIPQTGGRMNSLITVASNSIGFSRGTEPHKVRRAIQLFRQAIQHRSICRNHRFTKISSF